MAIHNDIILCLLHSSAEPIKSKKKYLNKKCWQPIRQNVKRSPNPSLQILK
jgi:hypothetical protein